MNLISILINLYIVEYNYPLHVLIIQTSSIFLLLSALYTPKTVLASQCTTRAVSTWLNSTLTGYHVRWSLTTTCR